MTGGSRTIDNGHGLGMGSDVAGNDMVVLVSELDVHSGLTGSRPSVQGIAEVLERHQDTAERGGLTQAWDDLRG